jgi:small subunit ribosomal protein S17
MTRTRNIGFEIKSPSAKCNDNSCPFHSAVKVRGKQFIGRVVSDKMQHSAVVEWVGWGHIPKYERYKKRRTKVTVHNSPCVNAVEGDLVRVGECRPLSKTKNFVILEIIGKVEKYALEKEALEEGKHKEKLKEEMKKVEAKQETQQFKEEYKE